MREYDTGLLVESEQGSRWYVSLYTVAAPHSLETLLTRLPEAEASPRQLRTAAQRALDALRQIDVPALPVRSGGENEAARHIFGMCAHVVGNSEFWSSEEEAAQNLRRFLRMSQHACLLLGARLPRDYVKRLHFQAVLVGFTDDSEEEAAAFQALNATSNEAPSEVGKAIEAAQPFVVAQTCTMVQELLDITPEVRGLIRDTLLAATEHFSASTPAHARAGMVLLTRISQDLEGVRILAQAERPAQALTLDAVIFELSYLIGYFGADEARAERWLRLKDDERLAHDDGSFPTIKDFVGYTLLNVLPNLQGRDLREKVAERYSEYKFLCGFKHGHAGNTRRAATSPLPGGGWLYAPDPQQDYLETWLTLVGIWKGLYLALTVGLNAFYQFSHHTPELGRRLEALADRLTKLDTEHAELERVTGIQGSGV